MLAFFYDKQTYYVVKEVGADREGGHCESTVQRANLRNRQNPFHGMPSAED
jgi:hypothetical protein